MVNGEEELHFCDSPEKIQKCLNCTKPVCTNCLSSRAEKSRKRTGARYSDIKREIADSFDKGMTNQEIADAFDVRVETVRKWKHWLMEGR